MTTTIGRRGFLGMLGAAAGGIVLAKAEPVRRFWQVSSSAPVAVHDPNNALTVVRVDPFAREVWLSREHGRDGSGDIYNDPYPLGRHHPLVEQLEGIEPDYGAELLSAESLRKLAAEYEQTAAQLAANLQYLSDTTIIVPPRYSVLWTGIVDSDGVALAK